jgi:hypothetical protein
MIRVSRAACVAGAVLCVAQPAFSSDAEVDQQLSEMRELVKGLQQKVDAQEEQLSHQGELLEDAQSAVREEADFRSNLASFLEKVEIDSWVATSYFWNFNKPSGRVPIQTNPTTITNAYSGGANGNSSADAVKFYPFHPDHNTFALDQIWLGFGKPATEDSRAGARVDFVFGNTAQFLGQGSSYNTRPPGAWDEASAFYVVAAYAEYLAPVADGLDIIVGKFQTISGAEIAQTTENFNITRGALYNLLQPLDHLGFFAEQSIGPATVGFGVANGNISVSSPDNNKGKTILARASYGWDMFTGIVNYTWGVDNANDNSTKTALLDLVLTADPTDALSMWLNFDYGYEQGSAAAGWGLALAGRYALLDNLGIAGRAEYGADNGNFFGMLGNDTEFATLTGTIDYTIVEGLMLRGEVRWDWTAQTSQVANVPFQFFQGNASFRNTQTTIGADVIYTF